MAGINEYSKTPGNNTSINGINIAEGCLPGNVNDGMRQQMADTLSAHTYVKVTNTQLMVNTQRYLADTTAAAFTLTLPGNPEIGDRVTVRDAGDWSVNNLTIGRNGNTIDDDPNDLVLAITGAVFEFVWDGGTWEYTPIVTDSAQLGGDNTFTGDNTFASLAMSDGETTVTKFSTDVTLADDSDEILVSQKALKAYIDTAIASYGNIGSIEEIAYDTPDAGWLLCDGSAVSRTTYAALYAKIGDTFGAGDGSTTFNLPDKRDRVGRGAGTIAGAVGNVIEDQVGPHDHPLTDPGHIHEITDPGHTHSQSYVSSSFQAGPGVFSVFNGAGSSTTGSSVTSITIDSAETGITIDATTTDETRVKSVTFNYQIKAL